MIGIDPGQSGGVVLLDAAGRVIDKLPFAKATDHDIAEWLTEWDEHEAVIESVHSMPKQGVASSFKFGRSFGFLIGLLTGLKIPYRMVTPQTWQKAMGCLTHGDKNVSKAAAQRVWPREKWTHALADAALIAEYGRRTKV
jgi:crossover junction endodeoxyribonuclease RuvC